MIVVTDRSRKQLLQEYDRVEMVGPMQNNYALRWSTIVYLCHGRKVPFSADWARETHLSLAFAGPWGEVSNEG